MAFSKQLSDNFGTLKTENSTLKQRLKKEMGSQSEVSPLVNDLKHTSLVECLDRLPQVEDLRNVNKQIQKGSNLKDLADSLNKLLGTNQQNDVNNQLTLETILANRNHVSLDKYTKYGKVCIDSILQNQDTPQNENEQEDTEQDSNTYVIKALDSLLLQHKNNLAKLQQMNDKID